jgi:hypothetical protein
VSVGYRKEKQESVDMVENRNEFIEYKQIEDLKAYVRQMISNGSRIVIGEKMARIAARTGIPGEEIASWSVDAAGKPILEKVTMVSVDESGTPDWVVAKIDEQGREIIDANGHTNKWVIDAATFSRKYEGVSELPGVYKPVGGPQKFVRLREGIHIVQWGEEWYVDAGGYINITNPDDMYVIAGRDFDDTYRLIQ